MRCSDSPQIAFETAEIFSRYLERSVRVDFYFPSGGVSEEASLLLVNDGQDLEKMGFKETLETFYAEQQGGSRIVCAGIHAGPARVQEYGVAASADYAGRGGAALAYSRFVLEELLPFIYNRYKASRFTGKAFAGWSLGALSAMDLVWTYPGEFSMAGLFSGSFWWRKKDQSEPGYSDDRDRIMHRQVREGSYYPGIRFFFECGTADETEDRNKNGVIDSIDDTQDLIRELMRRGYGEADINYLEVIDGRHDLETWARVLPAFLRWGWAAAV